MRYMLDRNSRAEMLYLVMEWDKKTESPLADYLVGVQLHSLLEFEGAVLALSKSPLSVPALEEQRIFLLAQSYFHSDSLAESHSLFAELLRADNPRLKMEAEEWIARINWKRVQKKSQQESSRTD